jgi:GNAT superfamily N-acetyltransferase
MEIRAPKLEDKAAMIALLQLSLGEAKLKKTQEIWDFKHVLNPFGVSPVLLAEEHEFLVGVRAFMQWRWQLEDAVWVSYRAVDTATHPDFQGRGIFKTLTLKALDYIQKKGDCFVFNTPNDQSRPGYLKMGWQEVGKINVALIPTVLYGYYLLFFRKNYSNAITTDQLQVLCEQHNKHLAGKKVLFTPKSFEYLKWRYEENPLQDYFVISTPNFYIAMYVKRHRFFNELRVVETISNFTSKERSAIHHAIIKYAFQNRCWFITTADKDLFSFRFYGGYGPKLTFRALTESTQFVAQALTIKSWYYSLGDLELF